MTSATHRSGAQKGRLRIRRWALQEAPAGSDLLHAAGQDLHVAFYCAPPTGPRTPQDATAMSGTLYARGGSVVCQLVAPRRHAHMELPRIPTYFCAALGGDDGETTVTPCAFARSREKSHLQYGPVATRILYRLGGRGYVVNLYGYNMHYPHHTM